MMHELTLITLLITSLLKRHSIKMVKYSIYEFHSPPNFDIFLRNWNLYSQILRVT